jgi:post-segregation antitoxin (ccd killing protein)
VADAALRRAVADERRRRWQEENAAAFTAQAARLTATGGWLRETEALRLPPVAPSARERQSVI